MSQPDEDDAAGAGAPSRPRARRRGAAPGYSLLEILIVVAIIGLLVTLVAPQLFGRLDQSRVTAAIAQISSLRSALDSYRLDVGHYPSNDEGLNALITPLQGDEAQSWHGPYLDTGKLPVDPWGHPYLYATNGPNGRPAVYSYGSDGAQGGDGTAKDIGDMPAAQ